MDQLPNLNNLVPTLDEDVKDALRRLNQPITRFGEDASDRRDRLISLLQENEEAREEYLAKEEASKETPVDAEDEDEEFYTPGPDELYDMRVYLAEYSLEKAKRRLETEGVRFRRFDVTENLQKRREYYTNLAKFELEGSQTVSSRFTSAVKFSPDGTQIAAGSWDGGCYIYDSETLELAKKYEGLHTEKVSAVDWCRDVLVTGGAEGALKVVRGGTVGTLSGHTGRITDAQVHPSGKVLASSSYDQTWRLWDIERATELYYQEGHSKEVSSLRINPDGSLLASGGLDAIVRVWDLRIGRSVAVLQQNGHIKGVLAMDWRPSGYQLITGGADNNLKVWDLRRSDSMAVETILAHSKPITGVRVSADDQFVVSCGYDGCLDLISCDSFNVVKRFRNTAKLMACDVSPDCKQVVAGGWGREVKIYR